MKRFIEGEARTQVTLLPECLDDYVTEEIQSEWSTFSSMNSTWAHNSDSKNRLLGISKRGDAYLRTLMIHGARSALRTAKFKDARLSHYADRIAERSHPNVTAIALVNKTARMVWAMLRNGSAYQPDRAAA
jgi:hypothetical protein